MSLIRNHFTFIALLLLTALVTAAAAWHWKAPEKSLSLVEQKTAPVQYTCPMHPNVISDKAGDCPACGMHLVVRSAAPSAAAPAESAGECCGGMSMPAATACPYLAATTNLTSCPMHQTH